LLERTLVFTYASMTLEGVEFTMESDFDHGLPTRMFRNRAYKGVNWKFTDCLFRDASQATMSITGVLDSFMVADGSWHYDSLDYVENASFIVDGDTIAQPGLHGVLDTLIIDNCVFKDFLLGGPKINHKPGHGRGVFSYIQFTNNTVSNTDHHTISFAMRDVDEGSDNSLYGTAVIDHNTIHGIAGGSKNAIQLKYVNSASTIMNTTISDVSNQVINIQESDSVKVDYCNWYNSGSGPVQQWTDGGHNLQVDPLFADASANDFTLLTGSPLIGAGSDSSNIGDPRWPTSVVSVDDDSRIIIDGYSLRQNYPNPFNPVTEITFALPIAGNISLRVFNMLAQEVALIASGNYPAGLHTVSFNAVELPSGIYFYTLTGSGVTVTRKMILMK